MPRLRGIRGLEPEDNEITLDPEGFAVDGEELTHEELLDHLEFRQNGQPMKEKDGAWRVAAGPEVDREGIFGRPRQRAGRKSRPPTQDQMQRLVRFAEKIKKIRAAQGKDDSDEPYREPERQPDWPTLAEAANLSDWEKKAIWYRMSGMERTEAMQVQPNEESRKALQAAWRKLDRTGMKRLEEARGKIARNRT
jgi:hypothetical protein